MKKLMLSLVAVGALASAGGASADAECQAGSAWGTKPGCGPVDSGVTVYPNGYGNNSGGPANIGGILVPNAIVVPNVQAFPGVLAQAYPYGAQAYPYTYGANQQYYMDRDGDGTPDYRDNDRDGDGVRNSRDRYPDDPRYR